MFALPCHPTFHYCRIHSGDLHLYCFCDGVARLVAREDVHSSVRGTECLMQQRSWFQLTLVIGDPWAFGVMYALCCVHPLRVVACDGTVFMLRSWRDREVART